MEGKTKKQQRKVERIYPVDPDLFFRCYRVLKPNTNPGDWERNGRKYNIKGLHTLLKTENREMEYLFGEGVEEDLENYREILEDKKAHYR